MSTRKYREANREKTRAADAMYRKTHRQSCQRRGKSWRARNADKIRAKKRKACERVMPSIARGHLVQQFPWLRGQEIPDWLIDLKRQAIILKRLCRKLTV